ncbi:hypothetical protein QOZ84_00145 [Romboutsia sedimentorum]|uniref:Uncharacterized protein n=1 Tax=Romboutsia sedimentorum TaxID=1368474 RepID=A0ABT7E4Z8_9FIRM|nr:hypothetical protein [Romboutsia sedimentorum]MDK2561942.1 hypothetical protein [Romboutsia sedimentorum]MDK2586736.1 hypothetical protein [Romboutsia sedimentorum]
MLDTLELILKIVFFVLSFIWIGRIMILRTDKQIVINPVLIGIGAILAVFPQYNSYIEVIGISMQSIRVVLYCIYSLVVIFGIYTTNQKNGIF